MRSELTREEEACQMRHIDESRDTFRKKGEGFKFFKKQPVPM